MSTPISFKKKFLTCVGKFSLLLTLAIVPVAAFAHDVAPDPPPSPAQLKVQKLFLGIAGVVLIGAAVYRFGFRGKGQADRWE